MFTLAVGPKCKFQSKISLCVYLFSDLSFNNIEVIEGLDKLTKLEDLTLYNNRISRIENMDHLQELHVFSVGNNDLKDQTNVSIKKHHQK